jgi:hypothetical protein
LDPKKPAAIKQLITNAMIVTVDELFKSHLLDVAQWMGSDEDMYIDKYIMYRDEVIKVVLQELPTVGDEDVLKVRHNVKAKLTWMFQQYNSVFIGYLPFVTPSVPPVLNDWLKRVDTAIVKVSQSVHLSFKYDVRNGHDISCHMIRL